MRHGRHLSVPVIVSLIVVLAVADLVIAAPPHSPSLSNPTLGPVLWTYSADPDTGQPLSSGNKVSGVGPVCVSIRYNGLSPGTNYTYEWYHNGVLIKQGQDEVDADSGYIVRCHHFIMGSMEFVLQVGDLTVRSDPATFQQIRKPPDESVLRCGPLSFWGVYGKDDDYTPIGGSRFAQGTYDFSAQWRCHNAPVGSNYGVTWLYNGNPVARQEGVLDKSASNFMENLADQDAPPPVSGHLPDGVRCCGASGSRR